MKEDFAVRQSSKRDVGIELARLMACLIVIGVHVCLGYQEQGYMDGSRLLIACFLADGVAVFWMITGAFLFRDGNYVSQMKKMVSKILCPMIGFSIIIYLFGGWLWRGENLVQSVYHTRQEIRTIIITLLEWKNPVQGIDHLWYLYVHILLIVCFPIMYAFVQHLGEDKIKIRTFLWVSAAFFVLNDLSRNALGGFSHHSINAVVPASIEMIWGWYLYKYRDDFKKHFSFWIPGLLFVIMNLLRMFLIIKADALHINLICLLYWYSFIGLFCGLCIVWACLLFAGRYLKTENSWLILNLSSCSFLIYLVHLPIYEYLQARGWIQLIQNVVFANVPGVAGEVVYTIGMTVGIFLISYLGVKLYEIGKRCLIGLYNTTKA
ncbi:MAG: acyltransferase [Lachnospiraceae bacterium]|nr:acyltransferase [Lachnospiraceae bacterium]